MTTPDRVLIARCVKRHGAWLISFDVGGSDVTEFATPIELYDVASSETKARRVARSMAVEFGFESLRWQKDDRELLLYGVDITEPEGIPAY